MLSQQEKNRYNRHLILEGFGPEAQEKLLNSKVLVIGAGGLGCPVLLYLAAAGVGKIGIVEFDTVDESNLQRQVIYRESDIGTPKLDCAIRAIKERNSSVEINPYPTRLTTDNVLEITEGYDVVIDTTDNFSTRYLVNDACLLKNIPLIYGAIYKFEGQVSVFNVSGGPSYRCVFPEPPSADEAPNCSEIGVIGVLPGIIGTMQATEAIKLITGVGELLSGKLLSYNALTQETVTFEVEANLAEIKKVLDKEVLQAIDYDFHCEIEAVIKQLEADNLESFIADNACVVIDVREEHEMPRLKIDHLTIPLNVLESQIDELKKDSKYIMVCQSGKRSDYAAQLLQKKGYNNIYNLNGGVIELIKQIPTLTV